MARSEEDEDDEDGAVPGYRNYLVYSDESGIHGANYYGFGTLWMPHERRGNFTAMIGALRLKHGYGHEIKWTKVKRETVTFYLQLLDEFFKRNWLMFHCLIVRKGYVDMSRHADIDEARRKHFAMLVKAKVKYFCAGASDKAYHFRIDPFPSRCAKADEVAFKIAGAQLKNELSLSPLKTLFTRDSKATSGIQVADVLLGAAMADWQHEATSEAKGRVRAALADYLGWPNLRADTHLHEWKFNIWHFYDPTSGLPREAATWDVKLKIPTPVFRPHHR
jgi:Protein of unknown function (DUF3800)